MAGATADETMIYIAEAFTKKMNATAYKRLLFAVFKKDAFAIHEKYPEVVSGCAS